MTNTEQIEAEVLGAFRGLVAASEALDPSRYLEYIDQDKFSGLSADGKAWHTFKDLENVKVAVINPSTAILVNEYKQTIPF